MTLAGGYNTCIFYLTVACRYVTQSKRINKAEIRRAKWINQIFDTLYNKKGFLYALLVSATNNISTKKLSCVRHQAL